MSAPKYSDARDDSAIDDDLKLLNEMDIDADFNVWSNFRRSFSACKRESLRSTRNSMRDSLSSSGTAVIDLGHEPPQYHRHSSMVSISESELDHIENDQRGSVLSSPNDESSQSISFSKLSEGEQNDIRMWKYRLSRDQVFSRYYFPEQWELRELKTIQNFLGLHDPINTGGNLDNSSKELTGRTINSIFFPQNHEPKSVLIKRGPILFDGTEERELFLFTHGLALARIEFDSLMNLLLAINSENPEYFTSKQLRERFNTIDSDDSGSLDRCELREVFQGMGVPVSELALTELMERFDQDDNGTITFDEFESVIHELEPKQEPNQSKTFWSSLGKKLKEVLVPSDVTRKLEKALPLSEITKIESLDYCHSEETSIFYNSSWANTTFAIFINGKKDPWLMVCSKPEHRAAWVHAFSTCLVSSVRFRSDNAARNYSQDVGWQHKLIRASLASLVVCNDSALLQKLLASSRPGIKINHRDDYYGYTALHYAAILNRLDCASLLLRAGAKANIEDNEQRNPIDHAMIYKNYDMMDLLQKYGAKSKKDVLFRGVTTDKDKSKSNDKSMTSNSKNVAEVTRTRAGMSDAMSILKERGEKLEKLENTTAQLQNDASNYGELAKQLKEKKKKSRFLKI